ncbi:MAG: hypothetical protein HY613_05695 [Candidatus Rokubacteria bacterium]|nr:hypothetical protein [Candidatus Rokubacteria bacterium]
MAATSPGNDAELTRLRKRLDRERKVRFAAEAIAETTIRELYEKHQEVVLLRESRSRRTRRPP